MVQSPSEVWRNYVSPAGDAKMLKEHRANYQKRYRANWRGRHEAPASTEEADPHAAGDTCETAGAVRDQGAGLRSRVT